VDESPGARFTAACREGRLDDQWDPRAGRVVFHPRECTALLGGPATAG